MKSKLTAFFRAVWKSLSHNLWLKLLSLALAVLLWNSVISSDTSITRGKTISGLTAYVSGQATLEANRLALAEDPTAQLSGISVRLDVPRANYTQASADNVQVSLDLSSVRATGTQQVRLRATTAYGKVVEISPSTVSLNFERLDSRSVPVNVRLSGDMDKNRYYTYTRVNPSTITVSGASSVVQSVVSAYVYPDVTGKESSYTAAEQFALLDSNGNELNQSTLSTSSSSISVSVGIYPTKELTLSTRIEDVVTGQPAAGYEVQSVSIQPEVITVAADSELLDGLSAIVIEPVSVEGAAQGFSARASVVRLPDFRYISAEQVYVNVSIGEEPDSALVDTINVTCVGLDDSLTLEMRLSASSVYVTGPRSKVEGLEQEGIDLALDLTGLGEGEYTFQRDFSAMFGDSFTFEPGECEITVSLSPRSEEE